MADPIHQFEIHKIATLGHIGGQEIAKTGKGLLSYHMIIFHREGLAVAAALMVAPLITLAVAVRLLPPWGESAAPSPSP